MCYVCAQPPATRVARWGGYSWGTVNSHVLLWQNVSFHINRRTHDQMVQAARSGVQNIAEGSQASGTSKKTELKLTNVARASLEELRLDYEDFLRQRELPLWDRKDPRRDNLIARRCTTAD